MKLKNLLLPLALLLPMAAAAQSISPSQIEQFKNLPRAQQEALARQYGIDLDNIQGRRQSQQRPENIEVVESESGNGDDERRKAQKEREEQEKEEERARKNGGLKPFGYDLFAGSPTTFAPVTEIPVPNDYTLGPGDVLRIQLWGKENQQLQLPVSREGSIGFPNSGPLSVAGLSFDEARQQIQKLVSEQYIGVQASVSLGELRSMRVFVLGEARNPGSYTVSSLSTITNALYVSGGVKQSGSLRAVEHKRNGKLIGTLDLYDLLLNGDSSGDHRLQPGDVVFIPPVGERAGIDGEVYRPALYELEDATSLKELVRLAGGLTPQAYPERVKIERTNEDFLRIIVEADYTEPKGRSVRVRPGDHITIASIADITGQYIEVRGAATRPGRYAFVPGMRVSSVLNNLRNDLLPAADRDVALLVRRSADDHLSTLVIDLRDALRSPGSEADLILKERDQLLVFSDLEKTELDERALRYAEYQDLQERLEKGERISKPSEQQLANLRPQQRDELQQSYEERRWLVMLEREQLTESEQDELRQLQDAKREKLLPGLVKQLRIQATPLEPASFVTISGEVRYPGEYPIPANGGLADAIALAGGLKDSASLLSAELARSELAEEGDRRVITRKIALADVMAGETRQALQSRDSILIQPTPDFDKQYRITLSGEVRYPGEYTFGEGETLRDVILRAGGLTENAFPKGAVFTRQKLRRLEAQRLQEAEERLQGDLLGVQLQGDTFGGQNAQRVQQVQGLLEDVQNSRPVGRMVIDLAAVMQDERYQSIRLQDGDSLSVPNIPQSVSVFGEVQFPTSHLHQSGLTVDDYLERSGGPTRQADDSRVYVVKADGSVMLPEKSRWFGGRSQQLEPGDTIIMPIDVDRLNQLELWTNVSQIVYQIALGAAAVGNL
ncbi:SLBB domain-containing protein [uncultured Marinobacter sp.]|uniref:SLBB domain-containing protein n=2 Tax=unclassified Marinobacter TaxID=83889 RepID=UPI000C912F73|nr:sugar transporter [Marinobacter sp.]